MDNKQIKPTCGAPDSQRAMLFAHGLPAALSGRESRGPRSGPGRGQTGEIEEMSRSRVNAAGSWRVAYRNRSGEWEGELVACWEVRGDPMSDN